MSEKAIHGSDVLAVDIAGVAKGVQDRAFSAREMVEAALARIDALDPSLHAFLSTDHEGALTQADAVDAAVAKGQSFPLAGVPVGIKDLLDIKGQPTGAGLGFPRLAAFEDSTVVARLRAAGAIIIGKLAMTEGATYDHHPSVPVPVNPWGAEWWPGISSSGAGVAVAARLCHAAIGTDTAGSIRIPSAANGVTGIKPSWGRVSRAGLFPLAESLDHIGPLASSAADCAAVLRAIAGRDARDPTSSSAAVEDYPALLRRDMRGMVIGIDWHVLEEADPETARAIDDALDVLVDAGAILRDVRLPDLGMEVVGNTVEIAMAHADLFSENRDAYGVKLRAVIEAGINATGIEVARAEAARRRFQGEMAALFSEIHLLVTPAFLNGPPRWDAIAEASGDMLAFYSMVFRFMLPFNVVGLPSVVLPICKRPNTPPSPMQVAARKWRDIDALSAAHILQEALHWRLQAPALV